MAYVNTPSYAELELRMRGITFDKMDQNMLHLIYRNYKASPGATAVAMRVIGSEPEAEETAGVMQMARYVNPDLANGSDYFRNLDSMMKCVEKNAHVTDPAQQAQVCGKEFKNLRLSALNNKLLYSEVNRQWFIKEIQYQEGRSAW